MFGIILTVIAQLFGPQVDDPAARKVNDMPQLQSTLKEASSCKKGEVKLTFELRSSVKQKILIWQSPLEKPLTADCLEVRDKNGKAVEYKGISAKRGEPSDTDYITLEADKPVSETFDLASEYELKPGKYTVRFKGNMDVNKLPDSNVLTVDVR